MSISFATLTTLFMVAVVPLAPTEPVVVGMGVLAALDHTSPVAVIAVAAVGCSLSDHLLHTVGRVAGTRILARLGRKPATAAAWLARNSRRWGPPILVVGRWLPGGGTVGSVLAGALGWRLPRFTPVSLVGSTLWSTYVTLVGYLGGRIGHRPAADRPPGLARRGGRADPAGRRPAEAGRQPAPDRSEQPAPVGVTG